LKARIEVMLKDGVLDPQGEAVRHALASMGFDGVEGVRQGKLIEVDLDATDVETARAEAERMCTALLANTVIETFHVEIVG